MQKDLADVDEKRIIALKNAQRKIYDGAFEAALDIVDAILHQSPELTDALYMKAVCERYLKRFSQAEKNTS